ncbi:MAG: metallophosphatase domain-containing protein [Bacteroidetes bacterium]|nr:metallophosphatase domain-containing protein [Bacteroidota bacterium]MBS1671313.1 metallophosphatase domain-containing protein [Bacteroidota bacterium]
MITLHYNSKKIIAISDTHGRHKELNIPETDFLIHCGDACTDGDENQLNDFFKWFALQPAKHKIFIAGNHDLVFDLEPERAIDFIPKNVIYIENRFTVIDGITFCSLLARPWMHEKIEEKRHIDFLLTHGPAYSILDLQLGCKKLQTFVQQQQPIFHLFGHIHQTAQRSIINVNTNSINVCMKNMD